MCPKISSSNNSGVLHIFYCVFTFFFILQLKYQVSVLSQSVYVAVQLSTSVFFSIFSKKDVRELLHVILIILALLLLIKDSGLLEHTLHTLTPSRTHKLTHLPNVVNVVVDQSGSEVTACQLANRWICSITATDCSYCGKKMCIWSRSLQVFQGGPSVFYVW